MNPFHAHLHLTTDKPGEVLSETVSVIALIRAWIVVFVIVTPEIVALIILVKCNLLKFCNNDKSRSHF